jgi:hypothetical protein
MQSTVGAEASIGEIGIWFEAFFILTPMMITASSLAIEKK